MIKHYLKIALRNIKKYKGHAFISLVGLSIGMTCSIIIYLWVQDELSYDKFHEKSESLYITGAKMHFGDITEYWSNNPSALGPALKAEYPEVINSCRIYRNNNLNISYNEKRFNEEVFSADPTIFNMFTFPMIQGNPSTALTEPYSIVLTETMAEKYFGDENPVGKILRIENKYDFTVTGVLKNIPLNSTIRFNCLLPLEFCCELNSDINFLNKWNSNWAFGTYVQLQENISYQELDAKISNRINKEIGKKFCEPFLQPLTNIYLHRLGYGGGNIGRVRIFEIIGFITLIIACINFMNLTTARSSKRAKEIGLRKLVGADRKQINRQFFSETLILSFLSLLLALLLVMALLPVFNMLTGKELDLNFISNKSLIPLMIIVLIFTSVLAGIYPAIYISSFRPAQILKGQLNSGVRSSGFRKTLVVFQFSLTIILIVGCYVIYDQLSYILNKNLGYNNENIVQIPLKNEVANNYESFKNEMLQHPDVLKVSVASQSPLGVYCNNVGWNWSGKQAETDPLITVYSVDEDFFETFKLEMHTGTFDKELFKTGSSWHSGNIYINEKLADIMGIEHIVGEKISEGDRQFTIKGVIKDFHFKSIYKEIEPMIIHYDAESYGQMFLKINPENTKEALSHIEEVFNKFNPGMVYTFSFIEDTFKARYGSVEVIGKTVKYFATLAVILSCLGLYSLASFMAEQRKKEMGIRKIMGASIQKIATIFLSEFGKLVLISILIAWPISWFFINNWLHSFAYHVNIGINSFIISGLLTFIIALFTVCYHTFKTAFANLIDSLRYE